MGSGKSRKVVKVVAFVIVLAMILSSFSFVMMIPGLFGSNGLVVYAAAAGDDDPDQQMKTLRAYIEYIKENYKDDVTYQQLINGAFEGVTNSLEDPYSVYYETNGQAEDFVEAVAGEYSGVGLSIEIYDGQCRVVAPISGTPAEKSGIKAGDIIKKIDGADVSTKTLDEISAALRGAVGTKVTVTIDRSGQTLTFPLTRAVIKTVSVNSKMLDNKIGYIQITSFDSDSHEEFARALEGLEKQGIKGLVIDERNNPGGLISTALSIANQLMAKGPMMYTEHQGEIIETFSADGSAKIDFPIVMLVNEGSASASEILAGALQDSKTAKLVGTTTFGKGIAQQVETFSEGFGVKLSTLYFLTPSKKKIDHIGLTPDYVVADSSNSEAKALAEKYREFAPMSEKEKPSAGSVGLNVFGAQQRLSMLGYAVKVSGTMDDATVAAVKKFQKENGLYAGGVLDYTTMNILDKAAINYITGANNARDMQMEKAIELLKK